MLLKNAHLIEILSTRSEEWLLAIARAAISREEERRDKSNLAALRRNAKDALKRMKLEDLESLRINALRKAKKDE